MLKRFEGMTNLFMILIVLLGLSWVSSTGLFLDLASDVQLEAKMETVSVTQDVIYIKNTGKADLTDFVLYVNGVATSFSIDKEPLKKNDIAQIVLLDSLISEDSIRITTGESVEATMKVKISILGDSVSYETISYTERTSDGIKECNLDGCRVSTKGSTAIKSITDETMIR